MPPQFTTPPLCVCQTCHASFRLKASAVAKGRGKFCSRACQYPERITRSCLHCGTTFITWPAVVKIGQGRFCSKICGNTHRTKPARERFSTKYVRSGDCWRWTAGSFGDGGYGAFALERGKTIGAHVASYILFVGLVPPDRWVLHTCDNKWCVNPEHLWLGTPLDNVIDMTIKERRGKTGGARR